MIIVRVSETSPGNYYLCIRYGPVVQLNRTSDSGSGSRGFESRRGHKKGKVLRNSALFSCNTFAT
jgi:hypothetical protein